MKPPIWLLVLVILLVGLGLAGLIFRLLGKQFPDYIADLALIFTLAALLLYVYYTYLLAKDVWMPSASFELRPYPNNPYHFAFFIKNHSKASLKCWCKLNATVYGTIVPMRGFYGGQHSFDIQPFGGGTGHFDIQNILGSAGYTLQQIKQAASPHNLKKQLYLDIEFWYNSVGADIKIENPRQPHYFDFARDVIVADF